MSKKAHILVVEDEPAISEGLTDVLIYHGYDVDVADTGPQGLEKALTGRYSLVLLDIMLPGMDGYTVCDRVRAQDREQPIIMLTAKSEDEDVINGLRLGADDYVAKPFSVQQLVLRIEAVLRRSGGTTESPPRYLKLDGLIVDTANLSAEAGDTHIQFTKREIELLSYLAENDDRAVPREELLHKVWGYAQHLELETRTVDIHIAKLRRKIERDPKQPRTLVTIRGAGYRLTMQTERIDDA